MRGRSGTGAQTRRCPATVPHSSRRTRTVVSGSVSVRTTRHRASSRIASPQAAAITVTVGNPTTYGSGLAKHTRYNVQTTTSLPSFPRKEMSVWRRFSDFEWLHKR